MKNGTRFTNEMLDKNSAIYRAGQKKVKAVQAFMDAFYTLREADAEFRGAEDDHYKKWFDIAREHFGDNSFTASELEEYVANNIGKHQFASMVSYNSLDAGLRSMTNYRNRVTERWLPSDVEAIGGYKRNVHYYLPCDASGKPIEGAEPIERTSKGSKLYKFGD